MSTINRIDGKVRGDRGGDDVTNQTSVGPLGAHHRSADVNFLDLDLNLLIALDALLGEQSVTRAAALLQRSQPALSASLKRLRHQFEDELLVRVGNRYELTPLATQLRQRVAMVMADTERLFATRARFDPETSTRQFVLRAADYGQQMLGRAIAAELAEQAPNTVLQFRALSDELIAAAPDALRNVDGFVLPLGFLENLPHLVAYEDRWVLLVDIDNRVVGDAVTLDQLAELKWVSAFHRQGSSVPAVRQLQLLGVGLRVVVDVEGFASLPGFVKGTDRITMIQERLARRIAPADEFRLLECPFDVVPLVEALWWHPSLEHDPRHIWFRSIVERAGRRLEDELAGERQPATHHRR
jgi:DNA-binding transcriptional LysR family regulator